MNPPETLLETRPVHAGRVVDLRIERLQLASGHIVEREIIAHKGAVCAVPVFADGRIGMIRQWRTAARELLWELPAGGLEAGESPIECARRELVEEIGFQAAAIEPLFQCFLAPGYSSEMMWGFLATDLEEVGARPEEDEQIELVIKPLEELLPLIDSGEIRDSKTICGLLALYRRRQASGK